MSNEVGAIEPQPQAITHLVAPSSSSHTAAPLVEAFETTDCARYMSRCESGGGNVDESEVDVVMMMVFCIRCVYAGYVLYVAVCVLFYSVFAVGTTRYNPSVG